MIKKLQGKTAVITGGTDWVGNADQELLQKAVSLQSPSVPLIVDDS